MLHCLDILDGKQGSARTNEPKYPKNKHKCNAESPGPTINTPPKYFCSMFYDPEKYFGSIGNFFNCNIKKGFYENESAFRCLDNGIFI